MKRTNNHQSSFDINSKKVLELYTLWMGAASVERPESLYLRKGQKVSHKFLSFYDRQYVLKLIESLF